MSKVNEQKALEIVIDHFHGNCTVQKAQSVIDELLDMGLAQIKPCLSGKKVVLTSGWAVIYDLYRAQSSR